MSNFVNNLDAFLGMTGADAAPVAWSLAQVDWPSDADRDTFINGLLGVNSAG